MSQVRKTRNQGSIEVWHTTPLRVFCVRCMGQGKSSTQYKLCIPEMSAPVTAASVALGLAQKIRDLCVISCPILGNLRGLFLCDLTYLMHCFFRKITSHGAVGLNIALGIESGQLRSCSRPGCLEWVLSRLADDEDSEQRLITAGLLLRDSRPNVMKSDVVNSLRIWPISAEHPSSAVFQNWGWKASVTQCDRCEEA